MPAEMTVRVHARCVTASSRSRRRLRPARGRRARRREHRDGSTDWDSLHHIELMLAIEMEFGVQISSEAMPALLSVDAIEEYLREQGVVGVRA